MQILKQRLAATYAGIVLVTPEEARAQSLLHRVCAEMGLTFTTWYPDPTNDPLDALSELQGQEEGTLLLMHDMHLFLSEANPVLYRAVKQTLVIAKQRRLCLVFVMPTLKLPVDLERSFSVIDFELPGEEELTGVLHTLCQEDSGNGELTTVREMPTGEDLAALLDAAAGLTTNEAEDAFALSLATEGKFHAPTVLKEKAATVRKSGLVEYLEPKFTLADVGGWDAYKEDLLRSRNQFTRAALDYRLEPRKGALLLGQGGTGKSLVAPIAGAVFGIPVLSCNAMNLGSSNYGGTEANWRAVMNTARSLKKCVLFIDEIDGATSGAKSSGSTDGGTTARLIKAILQDVQNSTGIYFVFTANDIDDIPDPLIDRLEVWSVDLPTDKEREEIWSIHIRRRMRSAGNFDLKAIVKASDGFSGRQIERAWLAAMTLAFDQEEREPQTADVLSVCSKTVATAITMKDAIAARRARLKDKARPVTTPIVSTAGLVQTRKISQ